MNQNENHNLSNIPHEKSWRSKIIQLFASSAFQGFIAFIAVILALPPFLSYLGMFSVTPTSKENIDPSSINLSELALNSSGESTYKLEENTDKREAAEATALQTPLSAPLVDPTSAQTEAAQPAPQPPPEPAMTPANSAAPKLETQAAQPMTVSTQGPPDKGNSGCFPSKKTLSIGDWYGYVRGYQDGDIIFDPICYENGIVTRNDSNPKLERRNKLQSTIDPSSLLKENVITGLRVDNNRTITNIWIEQVCTSDCKYFDRHS